MRSLALSLVLVGCTAAAPPPAPTVEAEPSPELGEGSCFGLAEADAAAPRLLLGGRLLVTLPAVDQRVEPAPPTAPRGRHVTTRLLLRPAPEAALVLAARELFRSAEAGALEDAVREVYRRDPRFEVHALELEGLEAVAAVPRRAVRRGEAQVLIEVFTRTGDGLVQETSVVADPVTATTEGCQRAALTIAESLRPGRRSLRAVAGRVALRPGLSLELPTPHVVEVVGRSDGSSYALHGLEPLDADEAPAMTIHVGALAPRPAVESARRSTGELLGRPAEVTETRVLGRRERTRTTEVPDLGPVRVVLEADERETMATLQAIVDTLSTGAAAEPRDCAVERAPTRTATLGDDPAVAALLGADRFARSAIGFDAPADALVAAFRQIAARPHAGAAFEHLAAAEELAPRLWGLAGLSAIEDEGFEAIFCHLAPSLEGEVAVHTLCGTERVGVGILLESARASGALFWEGREYAAAELLDLRGGGIGYELRFGPVASEAVRRSVTLLRGGEANLPFDGDRRRSLLVLKDDRLCGTRRDGRFACVGAEGEALFGEAIRHPVATTGMGTRCFVDREGRRFCAGAGLDRALATRARRCGGDPPAPLSNVRAFADGPWRLVDLGPEPCGIDEEGTLHCFRTAAEPPSWAQGAESLAFGAAYPVLGGVTGASRGHGDTRWAWTEEGRVFRWSAREAPRPIAELPGLERIVGGMRVTFAEMADGRVLALGPQPGEPWWDLVGQLGRQWVEVPELGGGQLTVGAYHGCAIFRGGVVKCWGAAAEGQLGAGVDGRRAPLSEVRELRGGRSLHLAAGVSCVEVAGARLRCVGAGAPFLGEGTGRRDIRARRLLDEVEGPHAERPPSE